LTGRAQVEERTDAAFWGRGTAEVPAVMDHVHVKAVAKPARDEFLYPIVRLLPVEVLRNEFEPLDDAQTVAVDRKYVAIQRVQKNAASSLRPYSRERKQEPLGFLVGHPMQRFERYFAEAGPDRQELLAKAVDLHRGHTTRLERRDEPVAFDSQKRGPVTADYRSQPVVGIGVGSLAGPEGQLDEDELVKRIGKVPERSGSVPLPEPTVDLR